MGRVLNLKTAEKFSRKIFRTIPKKEDRDFLIMHAQAVARTALILSAKNTRIKKDILAIASWVHDIGYVFGSENHAQKSIRILEENDFNLEKILRDCILNHGTFSKPTTREGRVFQAADKVSFIDPGMTKLLVKYNDGKIKKKDLEIIKIFLEKAVEFLGTTKLK